MIDGKEPPKVGDVFDLPLDKPEPRKAVLLKIDQQMAFLIYGSGTRRSWPPHREVAHTRLDGKALKLTKRTFFYCNALAFTKYEYLLMLQRIGRCRPDLLLDLRELAEQQFKKVVESPDLAPLVESAHPVVIYESHGSVVVKSLIDPTS